MYRRSAILLSLVAMGACSKQGQEGKPPQTQPGEASASEPMATGKHRAAASGITWLDNLDEAKALASKTNRDLFIDISATWCAPCTELEEVTFADPTMAGILKSGYVTLNLDVSEQNDADLAHMAAFGVKVLPALLVVREGEILLTIRDFIGPSELANKLAQLAPRPN